MKCGIEKYMVTMNFLIDTKITSNQNKNYAVTQKNITQFLFQFRPIGDYGVAVVHKSRLNFEQTTRYES